MINTREYSGSYVGWPLGEVIAVATDRPVAFSQEGQNLFAVCPDDGCLILYKTKDPSENLYWWACSRCGSEVSTSIDKAHAPVSYYELDRPSSSAWYSLQYWLSIWLDVDVSDIIVDVS